MDEKEFREQLILNLASWDQAVLAGLAAGLLTIRCNGDHEVIRGHLARLGHPLRPVEITPDELT